jgi:predicted DNA-binding transcriptional regulator AlpA
MHSESLVRLVPGEHEVSRLPNEALRDEIARQTREFLSRGGSINVIPTAEYQKGFNLFNSGTVIDPMTKKVLSRPSRELINGRMIIRMSAMELAAGMSDTKLRNLSYSDPTFPKPVAGLRPRAWDEAAFLAWLEKHNG